MLDLSGSVGDRGIFADLLRSADLFVEATAVGYLEDLGFDSNICKKLTRLVTLSLTPFGRKGPYRNFKGSDAIANAAGGFLLGQGDDTRGPCTAPCHSAYQVAACSAAVVAIGGLRHRRRSGAGQHLDISLQEALTFTNSNSVARYSRENRLDRRPGSRAHGGAGTNIYRCKDGRACSLYREPAAQVARAHAELDD